MALSSREGAPVLACASLLWHLRGFREMVGGGNKTRDGNKLQRAGVRGLGLGDPVVGVSHGGGCWKGTMGFQNNERTPWNRKETV